MSLFNDNGTVYFEEDIGLFLTYCTLWFKLQLTASVLANNFNKRIRSRYQTGSAPGKGMITLN